MNGFNQRLPQLVIPGEGQGLWVAVAVSLPLNLLMVSLFFKVSLGLDKVVTPTTVREMQHKLRVSRAMTPGSEEEPNPANQQATDHAVVSIIRERLY